MQVDPSYYAKILLFGEYGIIEDSMGLSIPFHSYMGKMELMKGKHSEIQEESNIALRDYLGHLQVLEEEGKLPCELDLVAFAEDIDKGLYFESSIPQGFGVGSSGALVAAVYARYAPDRIRENEAGDAQRILELKNILAGLEGYFHGKSSGLDPLICYLNLPVLIRSKSDLGTVIMPGQNSEGKGAIFLMDSGKPGKTQSMVALFLTKLKEEGFRKLVKTKLKQYNDECIKAFLKGDTKPLFSNLKELSSLFLENFKPMIPEKFQALWKQGIDSNAYYLKLCGSGGGGFVLGFTEDIEHTRQLLKDEELAVIHRF